MVWVQPAFAQQGNGSCAALLIGNSNYMWGGDPALKEPINDARSLGDELGRAGFDVEVKKTSPGTRCSVPSTASMRSSSAA